MTNDECLPSALRLKNDRKHENMNQIRNDGSAKESMIFGNIGNASNSSNISNTGNTNIIDNLSNNGNIDNTTVTKGNSNQTDSSMSRKTNSSDGRISNDLQITDILGVVRKQPEEPIHREHHQDDDDMTKKLTGYKDKLKKGGRIPWWQKLVDYKLRDAQQPTEETVRNDEKDIGPNLKTDRFRQRSSGQGTQGLNSRHTTRAWGPSEKIRNERQNNSRVNLAGLNVKGDLKAA